MRNTLPSRRTEAVVWMTVTAVALLLYAGSWWLVLKLERNDAESGSVPVTTAQTL